MSTTGPSAFMTKFLIKTPTEFRFDSTLMSHGWIELAPFSHDEEFTQVRRVQRLTDGTLTSLTFRGLDEQGIEVEASPGLTELQTREIESIAHQMFNFDLKLGEFYEMLGDEVRYEWVRRTRAGRLLRSPTVWEDLAKTLMTTNTTWAMTRNMVKRLAELGERYAEGLYAFPSPERIAALSLDELSQHVRAGYRNAYLHGLALDLAEGRIDVEEWRVTDLPAGEIFKRVRACKGFGPYAAGTMLKLLGRFDELAIDSAARSMFAVEFGEGKRFPDAAIKSHYERYGTWRGLVIWMDLMRDWYLRRAPRTS